MEKKKRTYCCVPLCKSRGYNNDNISYHTFPKPQLFQTGIGKNKEDEQRETLRLKSWIDNLRIGKNMASRSVVCSKHFQSSDFYNQSPYKKRRRLLSTAIPSLCLPPLPTNSERKGKQQQAVVQESDKKCYALIWIPNNAKTAETLPTKFHHTEVFKNVSNTTSDTYLDSLSGENITELAVSEKDVLPECPASFVSNIKIKTEELWEESYGLEENVNQIQDQDNKINKERNEYESSSILLSNKHSACSKNKKHLEPSDGHREKIFGLLVASEMRTLKGNPTLYLKTKNQILETLSDAQMRFLNYKL